MKIVPYDECVTDDVVRAVQAARTADEKRSADFFEGAQWCRDNMSGYVRELTTCGDCIYTGICFAGSFGGRASRKRR